MKQDKANSPLIKSLCRRGRVIVAEDKAPACAVHADRHDRVESGDSGRECNAVIRPQGPDAARMDFFNGLLRAQAKLRKVSAHQFTRSFTLRQFPYIRGK